jgi:hypothetical protein
MEMPPDTLEAVGVNELFVAVTVDASFTTEQACNPTDIYKYIVPHPGTTGPPSQLTPLHQQRSWARAIQQDFQRTNVYWKTSTLITNITQPSLNNPKVPPKFHLRYQL